MITTIEVTSDAVYDEVVARLCPPAFGPDVDAVLQEKTQAVQGILEAVRTRGDAAVAEFTEQFDGVALTPGQFELTPEQMDEAAARVDPELIAALERAHANIRAFHQRHLSESWEDVAEDGTVLGQRVTPLDRVGVYVPGGKAYYPSSVLMNIVPACVAGVREIVMVSPPSWEGSIHPAVIAAARIAGATRVFRVAGAQAVAALAYGTERIPNVLKITGPGNTYVTVAKRLVRPVCDIDSEAGPSEVLVIADDSANPQFVAAEMLAQAEHDEEARSVTLTTSMEMAKRIEAAVDEQRARLPRQEIIEASLSGQGTIVVVRDLDEAVRLSDAFAPEHLSIQTEDPREVFDKTHNAGAVMLGAMTPVALGDYYAGPNHILPTGGRAKFSSPLTAEDFRKVTSVLSYSHERLLKDAGDVCRLAEVEGLVAHARAVEMRK